MATNENSMIDIPLYTESKLTRKQAINEITDVILRSNMKPRMVECALELLQKFLPVNNTLPTTIDELFRAMMSTENDWRLAQYLIKHKQSPSFLSSSTDMSDENSSSSDDENELSPYDRLQQCLRPITDISTNLNLNNVTSSNSSALLQSLKRLISETSPTVSPHEQNLSYVSRMFADFEDDSDDDNDKLCCFEVNGHNLLNDSKRHRYY